jgi:hypothetical protein
MHQTSEIEGPRPCIGKKVVIRVEGRPYLTRWILFRTTWFSVYLHHFHASDQRAEFHNHPWKWAFSLILAGGYTEERVEWPETPITVDTFLPWDINRLDEYTFHRVDLLDEYRGCWSLFVMGPRIKKWGFLDRATGRYRIAENAIDNE